MNTAAVTTSNAAGEPRQRTQPGDADAFAALLLGAQSTGLLATTRVKVDPNSVGAQAVETPPDAQRARIDGEVADARDAEGRQRRAGSNSSTEGSAGRLHAARAEGADAAHRTGERGAAAGAQAMTKSAQSAEAASGQGVRTVHEEPAAPRLLPAEGENKPGPVQSAKTATEPAGAPQPQPVEKAPAADTAIAVPTAGAARGATGAAADAGKSDAAQAVARILAARGESVRVESPAALTAQGGRNDSAARDAQRSGSLAGREEAGSKPGEPGGTEAARRQDFAQLVRLVRANVGRTAASATLRLDPPDLGRMKVDLRMTNDVLHLRVEVGSTQARDLVAERLDHLAAALREHDIRMERVEIVALDGTEEHSATDAKTSRDARDPSQNERGENVRTRSSAASDPAVLRAQGTHASTVEILTSASVDLRI